MAIHRGIQSALFYYLSCAPCTEARHRRERRKDADLARLETQLSDRTGSANGTYQYQHPLSTNTNPAWDLEIALGPSRESKAAAKQKPKKESSDVQSRSSNSTSKSPRNNKPSDPDLHLQSRVAWASTFQRTYAESTALVLQKPQKAHNPTRRSRDMTLASFITARPTLTMSNPRDGRAAAPPHSTPHPNYTPHPPLNDHHPPTVTNYASPNDIAWMLEAPPPARVMRGYENERPRRTPPRPKHTSPPTNHDRERSTGRGGPITAVATSSDLDILEDRADIGLGLRHTDALYGDEEVVSSESDAEPGPAMEKRDSAGPQPRSDGKGGFLFPPEEWVTDVNFVDSARRDPRWRWSIDW